MARSLFTGEEVVDLLDRYDSDNNGPHDDGLDDIFFPGSYDELGFLEEEPEDERCVYKILS